jgi:PEP-CTERM motif
LLLTNTLSTPVTITITVGATNFTAPVVDFATASSGVWQGPGGISAATFKWFVDPANAQGADNATDTPGVLVDSALSTSLPVTLAFAHNNLVSESLSAPYSMTEQLSLVLAPGESLVNRGQSIVGAPIPEPSTWAMLIIGFVGMAWGALTRKRAPF